MYKFKLLREVEFLAETFPIGGMYSPNVQGLRDALVTVREALQFPDCEESLKSAVEAGRLAGRMWDKLPGRAGGIARLTQLMSWVAEGDQQEIPCLLRQVESILAQFSTLTVTPTGVAVVT